MSTTPTLARDLVLDGRYRLIEAITDWGVGESWSARDTTELKRVTLKFLPLVAANDTRTTAEFQSLARRLVKLRHRGVVETRAFGFFHGRPYLVQESLDGVSLRVGFARARTAMRLLEPGMLANILDRACEAVEIAHGDARPLLHGALTPGSIVAALLDGRLVVRVLDFGLAEVFGARLGDKSAGDCTAPELDDEPDRFTPACDLFALGSIIMEAITDRRTVSGGAVATIGGLSAVAKRRDDVPNALMGVASRATRLEPEARYATAKELHEALSAAWTRPGEPAAEAASPPREDAAPQSWERYAAESSAAPDLGMFSAAAAKAAPVFAPIAAPPKAPVPRTAEMSEVHLPSTPLTKPLEETLLASPPAPVVTPSPIVAKPPSPASPAPFDATMVAPPPRPSAPLVATPSSASPATAPTRRPPWIALGIVALVLAGVALWWVFGHG
jgi:serine/threonine-protein kinase